MNLLRFLRSISVPRPRRPPVPTVPPVCGAAGSWRGLADAWELAVPDRHPHVRPDPADPLALSAECEICHESGPLEDTSRPVYDWCVAHQRHTGHAFYVACVSGGLIVTDGPVPRRT